MKKIIISNSQLKKVLAEENTTNVQVNTTGNSIPSLTNAVMQNQPKITNAAKTGDVSLHLSNPSAQAGSNDNIVTQHVEVGQGENISNAITKQVNPTALSQGGDVEVSGPGISEKKVFTKRMVEEARLKKMREEGVVLTKRALKESFLNNSDVNHTNESIEIKPENKGKFNATKKRTGKSTEELTHSKNPVTKKRAIFSQNAKKWNKSK